MLEVVISLYQAWQSGKQVTFSVVDDDGEVHVQQEDVEITEDDEVADNDKLYDVGNDGVEVVYHDDDEDVEHDGVEVVYEKDDEIDYVKHEDDEVNDVEHDDEIDDDDIGDDEKDEVGTDHNAVDDEEEDEHEHDDDAVDEHEVDDAEHDDYNDIDADHDAVDDVQHDDDEVGNDDNNDNECDELNHDVDAVDDDGHEGDDVENDDEHEDDEIDADHDAIDDVQHDDNEIHDAVHDDDEIDGSKLMEQHANKVVALTGKNSQMSNFRLPVSVTPRWRPKRGKRRVFRTPKKKVKLMLHTKQERLRVANISLTKDDLNTLLQKEWINDQVIHADLGVLSWESPGIYILPCFLAVLLDRSQVAKVCFAKYRWILMPNCCDNHWCLLAANVADSTVTVIDSLEDGERRRKYITLWHDAAFM
ncbi:hypothetical protein LSAT2_005884 [Lamellibrachia satsuma]|nr:hypothetical protein LSAT2_005884 [Lamellibrachia satsuma]